MGMGNEIKISMGHTMEEWFHMEQKSMKDHRSIVWKSLVKYFLLVGRWTTRRIGNGRKVWIGEDLWVGENDDYRLSKGLILSLHSQEIFSLLKAISHNRNGMGT